MICYYLSYYIYFYIISSKFFNMQSFILQTFIKTGFLLYIFFIIIETVFVIWLQKLVVRNSLSTIIIIAMLNLVLIILQILNTWVFIKQIIKDNIIITIKLLPLFAIIYCSYYYIFLDNFINGMLIYIKKIW